MAFALGIVQFVRPKGTASHRAIGWIWVILMAAIAVSSFWISELRLIGSFSPIHILSTVTRSFCRSAFFIPRWHRVPNHKRTMISLSAGLAIAGVFTLVPGRVMHAVVFGE